MKSFDLVFNRIIDTNMSTIEIIFAEFGRVHVDVDHFRTFFPDAIFTLFTNVSDDFPNFDNVHRVFHPFEPCDPRFGNHMNDFWQIKGMEESTADVCVAFDADMRIVSSEVINIIPLVNKFGLCLPANPRLLCRIDATIGIDGGCIAEAGGGNGFAFNTAITAMDRSNRRAVATADRFCQEMENQPVRGPLAWWRACWTTGFFPCLLPFQWCVCAEHVGIGNEIILHVGHEWVLQYYTKNSA